MTSLRKPLASSSGSGLMKSKGSCSSSTTSPPVSRSRLVTSTPKASSQPMRDSHPVPDVSVLSGSLESSASSVAGGRNSKYR